MTGRGATSLRRVPELVGASSSNERTDGRKRIHPGTVIDAVRLTIGHRLMSNFKRREFQPTHDLLDGRVLLSGGVSAHLWRGVLAVHGTSASAPIQVNILAGEGRGGAERAVVVQGVGPFLASRIRAIRITGFEGEGIVVVQPPRRGKIPVRINSIGGESFPGRLSARAPTPALAATSVPAPAPAATVSIPAPAVSPSSATLGTMSALEQAVVDLTNQARQQNGLPALQVSSQLVSAAQIHTGDMARLNQMAHTLPGVAQPDLRSRAAAVGYNYSWIGENIAFGYPDAPSVVTGWMNSPDHRENILNPNFTEIGVGFAWSAGGLPYATQVFGSRA